MKKIFSKVIYAMIAMILLAGVIILNVFAAEPGMFTEETDWAPAMPLVTNQETIVAPGVTLHKIVTYSGDGQRVELTVSELDLGNNSVKMFANYKENQQTRKGFQKITEQAEAFEANHNGLNVVAAFNASYYDMATGEPWGAMVMEGVEMPGRTNDPNSRPYFAILKDGTPFIGEAGTYNSMKNQIQEAIGGELILVRDSNGDGIGEPDYSAADAREAYTQGLKYPRHTIGITADGKVITMTADGRHLPRTNGTVMEEQVAIMEALGCIWALHIDGGGSGVFSAKLEGELQVVTTPADGFERAVSNSMVVVSTVEVDSTFDYALLGLESTTVAPGCSVEVSCSGVSVSGHNTAVPEGAVFRVKDTAMGTMVGNKFWAAADFTGDAVIQLVLNDEVVGEKSIYVTAPRVEEGVYSIYDKEGVSLGKYTGLFYDETVQAYRYSKVGMLVSGWVQIGNDVHYFLPDTQTSKEGTYDVDGYTFTFEADGRLTAGLWISDEKGTKYNYGPYFCTEGFWEIDGKTYCFNKEGYRYEGLCQVVDVTGVDRMWYQFTDEGVFEGPYGINGFNEINGKTYYLTDGRCERGLALIDYDYYCFRSNGEMARGRYDVWLTNDYLPADTYYFDTVTGKMINPPVKQGIQEEDGVLYFYKDDQKVYMGLVKIGEDYYYVNSSCKIVTGRYNIWKTNDLLSQGVYEFDQDGKMLKNQKNGIYEEDGAMYYYQFDEKVYAGLIELDGEYYYVNSSCKVVTGSYNVWKTNGLLDAGTYVFGADGKMIKDVKNGIYEENGVLYYYQNNEKTYAGLIELDGEYYYVNSSCKVVTGSYNVWKTNGLLDAGTYMFGADGKMVIPGADAKNGIYTEDGVMYYYQNDIKTYAGLIQHDGAYYYVNSKYIVVTGIYNVWKTNGLMPEGVYTFGEDGKMVVPGADAKNGIYTEDGVMYYYQNDIKTYAGLIQHDGAYYYVNSKCEVVTGKYSVWKTNGLVSEGIYEFGIDGKMVM